MALSKKYFTSYDMRFYGENDFLYLLSLMVSKRLNILLPIVFGIFMFLFDFLLSQFGPTLFSVRLIIWSIIQATCTYWIIYMFSTKWMHPGSESFVRSLLKSVLALCLAMVLVSIVYLIFRLLYPGDHYTLENFRFYTIWITSVLTFIEGILFLFILLTIRYFKEKTRLLIEKERLQEETTRAQFELLKTEINPHYLFNNFNTLYGLIQEDKQIASEFLLNFTQMYRYILTTHEKETVSIEEELEMVRSYIHVLSERYKDQLILSIEIDDKFLSGLIVPMGLQMVIENAIKHNQIDENHKLFVSIKSIDSVIKVENNINIKKYPAESTGKGLENLKKRYNLLTKVPLLIKNTEHTFTVELPIIKP